MDAFGRPRFPVGPLEVLYHLLQHVIFARSLELPLFEGTLQKVSELALFPSPYDFLRSVSGIRLQRFKALFTVI